MRGAKADRNRMESEGICRINMHCENKDRRERLCDLVVHLHVVTLPLSLSLSLSLSHTLDMHMFFVFFKECLSTRYV